MFAEVIDLRVREHFPAMDLNSQCAIERRFPHIVHELLKRWHSGDIDAYMDSLLIDTRGNRKGFPADVLDELIFLSGVLWHRNHANRDAMDQPHAEEFSFCAWDDQPRRCGTSGAWVLE